MNASNTPHECANCGADMLNSEKVCKYCGSPNPNYVAPILHEVVSPFLNTSSSTGTSAPKTAPAKVNWLVFVILLIFFWPAAIIYLVFVSAK